METEKGAEPEVVAVARGSGLSCNCLAADVSLRVLLLAASIVAVVLMVTSKQTEMIPVPTLPGVTIPRSAQFRDSPAFIFFVVALSIAGLYSIITTVTTLCVIRKSNVQAKYFWILAVHDVLILGLVAAATGTAGGVAYIGLKGNTHVNWGKICSVYDKFCRFVGSSIAVSLFASTILVLLVALNIYSLYLRASTK